MDNRGYDVALELIKKWEGKNGKPVLNAYKDSGGVPTIGYGHTHNVRMGDYVTAEEAEQLAREDMDGPCYAVGSMVKVPLNPNQFGALVSLAFNIGVAAFKKSTLLKRLNGGNYKTAAVCFEQWVYDNGIRVDGLVNRRKDERSVFERAYGTD